MTRYLEARNDLSTRAVRQVPRCRLGWHFLLAAVFLAGISVPSHASPPMPYSEFKKMYLEVIQSAVSPEEIAQAYMDWGERAFGEAPPYPDAVMVYEKLVERFPESRFRDDALLNLAIIHHYYLHEYEKALGYYRRLLTEKEFKVEDTRYHMSEYVKWTKGDVQSAVQHLHEVVETLTVKLGALRNAAKSTDKINAYWDLIELQRKEKNYPESLRLLTVLSQDPDRDISTNALHKMAMIYIHDMPKFLKAPYRDGPFHVVSDSISQGIELLEKIIQDNPTSNLVPTAMVELARALQEVQVEFVYGTGEVGYPIIGDYLKAEKVLTEYLQRFPDHELSREALLLLGSVYESCRGGKYGRSKQSGLERHEDAIRTYEYLSRKYPKSEEAEAATERIERIRRTGGCQ